MKKTVSILAVTILVVSFWQCGNASTQPDANRNTEIKAEEPTIQILYFHGDRRCPTCIKVGEISLNLFNTKYSNNTSMVYKEVNTDKEENKTIAEKYQITSSSLIIDVNGVVKNITVDAFKYAKSDPTELENLITTIIEEGLKK